MTRSSAQIKQKKELSNCKSKQRIKLSVIREAFVREKPCVKIILQRYKIDFKEYFDQKKFCKTSF